MGLIIFISLTMIANKGSGDYPNSEKGAGSEIKRYVDVSSISTILLLKGQLAEASTASSFLSQSDKGLKSDSINTIQQTALMAFNSSENDLSIFKGYQGNQIVEYTVQSGDTIGLIASDFDVSVNTIIWANHLRNPDTLSLGQILKIPPVTGVIHTVKRGDTITSIAKKYKADPDKILSFNNLKNDNDLETENEIMVPGGELPGPNPSVKSITKGSKGSGIYVPVGNGQCVDFVQAHGFSKMSGNAYQWAKYINTTTPTAGGVVVFRGGRFGHIALITAVKPNSIQIVEQNYYGLYIIDHREISLNDRSIVGFIQ